MKNLTKKKLIKNKIMGINNKMIKIKIKTAFIIKIKIRKIIKKN